MKINRLEAHDRLLTYQKQQDDMAIAVMECIKNVPDAVDFPFYVYGHVRTVGLDEKISIVQGGVINPPESRIIWMPIITKPKASPNTYLFLCRKDSDIIEIIWMLPKIELWSQYEPGKMFHNENIWVSIQNFKHNRERLNAPDSHGPTDDQQKRWFKIMGHEAHEKKRISKLKCEGASKVSFD